MGAGRYDHHTRALSSLECAEKVLEQQKMPEMVDPDSRFQALFGASVRRSHHPCIGNKEIDLFAGMPGGEFAYRLEIGEIQMLGPDTLRANFPVDLFRRFAGFGDITRADHDLGAGSSQRACGFESDPASTASNDRTFSGQIDTGDNLVGL
jgi:hypothetical protein